MKTGDDDQNSALGTVTLYVNDQTAGTASIKTQPGKFTLSGDGLDIGKDLGSPVSKAYDSPFAFKGGTLKEVVIDVSGEAYVDLEKEAIAMMKRE